jgi:hypothetical protein
MRRDVRILLVGDGEQFVEETEMWIRLMPWFVRGRGEEHHRHLSHQGVLCRTCELTLRASDQTNLCVFRSNTLSPK